MDNLKSLGNAIQMNCVFSSYGVFSMAYHMDLNEWSMHVLLAINRINGTYLKMSLKAEMDKIDVSDLCGPW